MRRDAPPRHLAFRKQKTARLNDARTTKAVRPEFDHVWRPTSARAPLADVTDLLHCAIIRRWAGEQARMLRKICAAAMLILALTTPAQAAKPDLATVELIEREITLPAGAGPLDAYDRYYALETMSGRRLIVGLFQRTSLTDERERFESGGRSPLRYTPPRHGRRRLMAQASSFLKFGVMDGGCSEIHVYWDIATAKIADVECNGLG